MNRILFYVFVEKKLNIYFEELDTYLLYYNCNIYMYQNEAQVYN